jgi:hypothetical protein
MKLVEASIVGRIRRRGAVLGVVMAATALGSWWALDAATVAASSGGSTAEPISEAVSAAKATVLTMLAVLGAASLVVFLTLESRIVAPLRTIIDSVKRAGNEPIVATSSALEHRELVDAINDVVAAPRVEAAELRGVLELIEGARLPMFFADGAGRVVCATRSGRELLRLVNGTDEAVVGADLATALGGGEPVRRALDEAGLEGSTTTVGEGAYAYEYRFHRADDDAGLRVGVVATVRLVEKARQAPRGAPSNEPRGVVPLCTAILKAGLRSFKKLSSASSPKRRAARRRRGGRRTVPSPGPRAPRSRVRPARRPRRSARTDSSKPRNCAASRTFAARRFGRRRRVGPRPSRPASPRARSPSSAAASSTA